MADSIDILLHHVGLLSLTRAHAKLDKLGLFKGQPPLLGLLFQEDGRTQKELVEHLKVSKATVSKMVNRMEKRGLLRLVPDVNNANITRVYLTEESKNLQEHLKELSCEMSDIILQNFTEEEKTLFERLLLKAEKNLI